MFWRSLSKSLLNCIAVLASGSMALLAQSSSITPNIAIVGGSIGDLVWNDANANGLQDTGEMGLSGWTVRITGANLPLNYTVTMLADMNGSYTFTALPTGTYTVCVTPPTGWIQTYDLDGVTTANCASRTISSGEAATNVDFGYSQPGSIGDFVWQDTNQNGIQDAGEPGINGVVVKLCADSQCNTVLATTPTASFMGHDGYYQFAGLPPGTYYVAIDNTQSTLTGLGLVPTRTGQGAPATDSNSNPSMATLTSVSPQDATIDFGYTTPGTSAIGDFVWQDNNANGIQDAGEPGLSGLTVNLCHDSNCGTILATTTTDQNGAYHFTGLFGGIYYVQVVPGAGFVPTTSQVEYPTNSATDSGGNVSGVPNEVSLPVNTTDNTIDFGFVPPAQGAIGDFVWHDLNRNGIQDAGEPGINNVTVRLYDSINTLVGRTTTVTFGGHDGYYQFTGLAAGTYQVVVDTTPSGYSATTGNAPSATTANDSNGSPATVTLASNVSTDETIDFGYVSPCAGVIGDFVWNDLNHNGIQDSGETGISGITLNLYDSNHVLLLSTTTDANGLYQFTGRCAGDYSVEVVPPAGSAAALTNASGSTAANDSNGSPATLTLGIDETNNTIDFGYYFGSIAANCVTIDAIQGVAITPVTMTATGGTGGYTYSAIGLPNGLSMSSGGTLSGTPTVSGTFNYTVTVTDKDGHTGTVSCSVTVNPPPTATCVVINAVQSVAITPVTMTATGGTGTGYTFSATGLPAGLTISSSGTISGTPTVSGIFNYTVTVTDGGGHTGTVNCSVTVTPPPNMCGLTWGYWKNHPWSTNSLLLGSHTYSQTELSALLGMPVQGDASINLAHQLIAAKFNVLNGTNPATDGGSIGAADALLNQFSAKLPYNVDPNSTVGQQMTTVAGQLDWFNSDGAAQPGCSAGPAPLTLTCAARTGQVGVAYSSAFAVSGGLAPYTFSIISGSLPSGLTLDPATAAVTGTPTTAGTFNFTIEVADATAVPGSITGTKTLDCSITIEPTKPTLTVKCPTGSATVGVVYSSSVTASGGTAPYSYGIYSGNLPAGLNLSAGGSLTGTPTGSGTYSFVVYAIDSTKAAYGYSPCTIVVSGGIVTGQFTTYTQGGWGAPAKGKNVGALLTSKFLAVYPGASVSIGGAYKLTFKSALAITNFLPQGATPGQLTANATNPTASRAGVFAGQVLALQLNVDFSNTGLLPTGLANLKVASGPMAGQTVMQVLATANAVLGGGALPKGMTISTLNSVVDAINNNFDGGMANKGYLLP